MSYAAMVNEDGLSRENIIKVCAGMHELFGPQFHGPSSTLDVATLLRGPSATKIFDKGVDDILALDTSIWLNIVAPMRTEAHTTSALEYRSYLIGGRPAQRVPCDGVAPLVDVTSTSTTVKFAGIGSAVRFNVCAFFRDPTTARRLVAGMQQVVVNQLTQRVGLDVIGALLSVPNRANSLLGVIKGGAAHAQPFHDLKSALRNSLWSLKAHMPLAMAVADARQDNRYGHELDTALMTQATAMHLQIVGGRSHASDYAPPVQTIGPPASRRTGGGDPRQSIAAVTHGVNVLTVPLTGEGANPMAGQMRAGVYHVFGNTPGQCSFAHLHAGATGLCARIPDYESGQWRGVTEAAAVRAWVIWNKDGGVRSLGPNGAANVHQAWTHFAGAGSAGNVPVTPFHDKNGAQLKFVGQLPGSFLTDEALLMMATSVMSVAMKMSPDNPGKTIGNIAAFISAPSGTSAAPLITRQGAPDEGAGSADAAPSVVSKMRNRVAIDRYREYTKQAPPALELANDVIAAFLDAELKMDTMLNVITSGVALPFNHLGIRPCVEVRTEHSVLLQSRGRSVSRFEKPAISMLAKDGQRGHVVITTKKEVAVALENGGRNVVPLRNFRVTGQRGRGGSTATLAPEHVNPERTGNGPQGALLGGYIPVMCGLVLPENMPAMGVYGRATKAALQLEHQLPGRHAGTLYDRAAYALAPFVAQLYGAADMVNRYAPAARRGHGYLTPDLGGHLLSNEVCTREPVLIYSGGSYKVKAGGAGVLGRFFDQLTQERLSGVAHPPATETWADQNPNPLPAEVASIAHLTEHRANSDASGGY